MVRICTVDADVAVDGAAELAAAVQDADLAEGVGYS